MLLKCAQPLLYVAMRAVTDVASEATTPKRDPQYKYAMRSRARLRAARTRRPHSCQCRYSYMEHAACRVCTMMFEFGRASIFW
eukprot:2887202-Prymnesium_polylepis.1